MRKRRLPPITADRARECLEYDEYRGIFRWKYRPTHSPQWNGRYAGKVAGSLYESNGYISITIDYQRYLAHRLAWLFAHGEWPTNVIDHRDGDKTNNRIKNLRHAGQSLNCANQKTRSNNTSGYKGVYFWKAGGVWRAQIKVDYKNIGLGSFRDKVSAAKAYNDAAKHYFGEYALLNAIPDNDNYIVKEIHRVNTQ